ncbi:MAG: helix-turn-helix transcriptional regulator [Bdellovibrionales bacterium]|nr:helix-turn-helix transcriptional regulator [Bdellovibrionales bacterium]
MDYGLESISENLASNLSALRMKRGMSQLALAKLAKVPRSTVAHLESGSGNPSLLNLTKISSALQIGLEELLVRPRPQCQLLKAKEIRSVKRSQGMATVFKLLPDLLPGMEIDRIEIEKGGRLGGIPHTAGTKEYLTCIEGAIRVSVLGENFQLEKGDVLAFPGDQPHAYFNTGTSRAVGFSVVALAR